MVFYFCLNFNFYGCFDLFLCFGYSLGVVGGRGFKFFGCDPVGVPVLLV